MSSSIPKDLTPPFLIGAMAALWMEPMQRIEPQFISSPQRRSNRSLGQWTMDPSIYHPGHGREVTSQMLWIGQNVDSSLHVSLPVHENGYGHAFYPTSVPQALNPQPIRNDVVQQVMDGDNQFMLSNSIEDLRTSHPNPNGPQLVYHPSISSNIDHGTPWYISAGFFNHGSNPETSTGHHNPDEPDLESNDSHDVSCSQESGMTEHSYLLDADPSAEAPDPEVEPGVQVQQPGHLHPSIADGNLSYGPLSHGDTSHGYTSHGYIPREYASQGSGVGWLQTSTQSSVANL